MGSTTPESALIMENIEEYVNDDSKIVTCRWLSLTLNVNINIAKQALFTFVQQQRNKGGNDDINVTYFVAGLGKTKSGDPVHKCVVVPESDLDAVKSTLTPVTSCHVYSVQKARLKDYTALYQTDYDIINQNVEKSTSLGSITCPWVSLRKPTGASSKSREKTTSSPVKKEAPQTSSSSLPQSSSSGAKGGTASATTTSKGKKPEPKGSIASMFAAGGKKAQTADSSKGKKVEEPKVKPAEQKKGMTAFFGKQKDSKTETESVKTSKEKPEKRKVSPKSKTVQEDSDDEGPQRKRRRRIKTDLFDSSDEENEEGNNSDVQIDEPMEEEKKESEPEEEEEETKEEPSPEKEDPKTKGKVEETKIVVTETGKRRKRTRKLVPKQYVDEDGFMVTEKVWESDSTDVDEEEMVMERKKKEEEAKKAQAAAAAKTKQSGKAGDAPGKGAPKKSAASPQKGKQTSLMSFFKKK